MVEEASHAALVAKTRAYVQLHTVHVARRRPAGLAEVIPAHVV
jgi:hypothetical protein